MSERRRYEQKRQDDKDWECRKARDKAEREFREYQMKLARNTKDPDAMKAIFCATTELTNILSTTTVPAHDIKERETSLAWYSEKLKKLNEEIREMKETISSWTESKNKLKKQKKKLNDLEMARYVVKTRIKELKD